MSETPGDLIQNGPHWGRGSIKGHLVTLKPGLCKKQAKAEVNDGRARKHGVLHALDWLGVKKLEGRANTLKKGKCPRLR
jgi:hypothetical protein